VQAVAFGMTFDRTRLAPALDPTFRPKEGVSSIVGASYYQVRLTFTSETSPRPTTGPHEGGAVGPVIAEEEEFLACV